MSRSNSQQPTPICGQVSIRERLAASISSDSVPHALLLHGMSGVGKAGIALEFARRLICQTQSGETCGHCDECRLAINLRHPDLHLIFPLPTKNRSDEKEVDVIERMSETMSKSIQALSLDPYSPSFLAKSKSKDVSSSGRVSEDRIRVELIRLVLREASMKPYQAARKIFVIFHAETMVEQAQNAFLKVLEDPPDHSYFILVCDNIQELLSTIRSRCRKVLVPPVTAEDIASVLIMNGKGADEARATALLSGGSMTRARRFASANVATMQDRAIAFLRCAATIDATELSERAAELSDTDLLPANAGLELLAILMRDIAALRADGSESALTFSSHRDTLRRLLQSYPFANLDVAVQAIDKAAADLESNLTPDWVYYCMATNLYRSLGPRATSSAR